METNKVILSNFSSIKLFFLFFKYKFTLNEENENEILAKSMVLSDIIKGLRAKGYYNNLLRFIHKREVIKGILQSKSLPQIDSDYANILYENGEYEYAIKYYEKAKRKTQFLIDHKIDMMMDNQESTKIILGNSTSMLSVLYFQSGDQEKAIENANLTTSIIQSYNLINLSSGFEKIYINSIRLLVSEYYLWGNFAEIIKMRELFQYDEQLKDISLFIKENPDFELTSNISINEFSSRVKHKISAIKTISEANRIKTYINNSYLHEDFFIQFRQLIEKLITKYNTYHKKLNEEISKPDNPINLPVQSKESEHIKNVLNQAEDFNKFFLRNSIMLNEMQLFELKFMNNEIYKIPKKYTIEFLKLSIYRYFIKILISIVLLGTLIPALLSNYLSGIIYSLFLASIIWVIDSKFIDDKIEKHFVFKLKTLLLKALFDLRYKFCLRLTKLDKLDRQALPPNIN